MTKDLMSAKTIAELTEKVEELEFSNLFLSNKVKVLEEKRVYYRKWREDQFKILFDILRTKDINKEETERIKIRLKDKDIHERFFYIKEELKNLTKVNRMITTTCATPPLCATSVLDYYNENVGGEYLDEDTSVINAFDVLKETMNYVVNDLPCEIRESVCEEMADDGHCIPDEIIETVIDSQISMGHIVSDETYDEKVDDCERLEGEIDISQEKIYNRSKKHDELKDISDCGELNEAIDKIFDKYDTTKTELQKFKSGYETLKECNEENDMIDMMEKIMDKTEEVANTDVKRCEEINRLKEKVNNIVNHTMTIEKKILLGDTYPLTPQPFHNILLNRGYIVRIMKNHLTIPDIYMPEVKINLSHEICNKINNDVKMFMDKMILSQDCILRDKIHEIIQTHLGKIFKDNGDSTYISYLCPEMGKCVLDKDTNRHDEKSPYYINKVKDYELLNKRYSINNYNFKITNKEQEEEIKDIHNY
tara:strand:- start:18638 stop:20074 length:1437 start_codon:yes stop_codon:yes gene_type:complete